MCKLDNEVWRDIKGYEGLYQVSTYGRIKKLAGVNILDRTTKERIMSPLTQRLGYIQIGLTKDRKRSFPLVHRVVAETFIPNPNGYPEVNHLDGDKKNNSVDNLAWCSKSQNMRHAVDTGLKPSSKGENNGQSKLTEEEVKEIKRLLKDGVISQRKIAERYKVTPALISLIKKLKAWKEVSI